MKLPSNIILFGIAFSWVLIASSLILNAQEVIRDKEGAFRIPIQNTTALSLPSRYLSHQKKVSINFPRDQKYDLYQIIGEREISDLDGKQYYVDFKKQDELKAGTTLIFKNAYLSRELISQLTQKFNPANDQQLITLMNSQTPEDWKTVLFGVSSEDITGFSGLAELKRRYQDADEHLKLMLDERYANKDYESTYFIPTGYVEVEIEDGKLAFLRINDLIQGKFTIDPQQMKVAILKELLLYYIEDLSLDESTDSIVLNSALDLTSCLYPCLMTDQPFGDLISSVIDIQISQKSSDEKLSALINAYQNFCGTRANIEKTLQMYAKKQAPHLTPKQIQHYFKLQFDYPNLAIEKYRSLIAILDSENLVPYALENPLLNIDNEFKKLAQEAFAEGLRPKALTTYVEVRNAFGDKNALNIDYYIFLTDFLDPLYLTWIVGPEYKKITNAFPQYNISVEEFIHLVNFAGSFDNLNSDLKSIPNDMLALRNNRASSFWVFPKIENQISKANDLKPKQK
jgi:hypothetical protein